MANNVSIPAQGTGDTTPKVSTDQVSADSSQVQNVQLAAVAGGVLTRNPTIPVSAAALPLPSGAATEVTLAALNVLEGAVTETAPATDTASSGLNGRLQRIAQRLTSLIALLPGSLGQKAMSASLAVVVASDQSAIPVSGTVTATGPLTDTQLRASAVPVSGTVTTTPPANASTNVAQVAGTTADTNSGAKSAGTLRVTLATDQVQLTNALKVDGSAVTQPVSGTVTTTPPANASTNLAQVAGASTAVGHGVAATALRVELPTDGTGVVGLAAGAATIGALTANQSVNVAQVNGVTPLMGAGVSGTGAARVTPSIAATGAAPTAFTSTTSAQIFASNASRRLFTVFNNSDQILYLMMAAAAASATSFHVKVSPGEFFSTEDYSGEIRGIMAATIGTGQVNPGEYT